MDKLQKEALQVTKELVVKFIEAGRVSPGNLGEVFSQTYTVVLQTIGSAITPDESESSGRREDGKGKAESCKGHVKGKPRDEN